MHRFRICTKFALFVMDVEYLYIMANASFYLDKRSEKKDGTFPVKIYVKHRSKFLLSTDFSATEETWAGNEYNRKEPNFRNRNSVLRALITRVEDAILELEKNGKIRSMTDNDLKKYLKCSVLGKSESKKTFVYYLDEFVSKKTNVGTIAVYTETKNKLLSFDPDCTFESMDRKWLERFERWMADSGMKVNAYGIHLRNVRAVFNYCIDEEYTMIYPFRKFQIKKEETRKRSLTVEQLRELRDYPCEEYQERYRDMFMLMFYLIGINAADLFRAKKSDVVNGRLEYKRAKTGKLYSIKIEPEAMEIIKRYSGKSDYLLNVCDAYGNYKDFLHRMNLGLRQIGETTRSGLGGKKTRNPAFPGISSYWCRHTWATLAASLDIPKETISEALGHSFGSSVTSIYIKFDNRKVDEANRKVIDLVNKE